MTEDKRAELEIERLTTEKQSAHEALRNREREHLEACAEADDLRARVAELESQLRTADMMVTGRDEELARSRDDISRLAAIEESERTALARAEKAERERDEAVGLLRELHERSDNGETLDQNGDDVVPELLNRAWMFLLRLDAGKGQAE